MKLSTIVCKAIVLVAFFTAGNLATNFISPMIANESALLQMGNSSDSSVWIQVYSYLTNYAWIIFALFLVLLFRKELVYIIKSVKSKFKEENNNEEH